MLYKKLVIGFISLVFMQPIFAAKENSLANYNSGFYLGGQLAYQKTNFSNYDQDSNGKFGPRLLCGYSFLPYLGLELGWSYHLASRYKKSDGAWVSLVDWSSFDLLGKGSLPLEVVSNKLVGWSLFAKAGIVTVRVKYKDSDDDSKYKYRPAYGLGLSYNFTDKLGIDLSWLQYYSSDDIFNGDNSVGMPAVNMFGVGIAYKF